MPPLRTMPPAKVLKTERTHEENQERAYIAASRRSDRSLEARVESARRASEIHKRRTGRSLRVTEQDVVNEEMYEEEDDDLPMQYRRLTAHLQTGSADFNRRLSAYLTNHVAMRTALDQAVTNSYAQQYPNAPQFAHNQSQFPSPFPQGQPQMRSPHSSYGQPYPSPGTPNYRPGFHARRASHSVVQGHSQPYRPQVPSPAPSSVPGSAQSALSPQLQQKSQPAGSASHSPLQQRQIMPQAAVAQEPKDGVKAEPVHDSVDQIHQQGNMMPYSNMSPFSMTLPMESQMFLNGALDPNDPMTSAFMGGNQNFPVQYGYGGAEYSKPRSLTHPFTGMSTTLAPSALDMQPPQPDFVQPSNMGSMLPSNADDLSGGLDANNGSRGAFPFPSSQESQGSGSGTPGYDAGWEAFINDSSWNENNVT